LKKLALSLCAAVVGLSTIGAASAANATNDRAHWVPHFTTLPARNIDASTLVRQAAFGQTIPFWHSAVTSPLDRKTYQFDVVGSDPRSKTSTTVKYVPIALRVHFTDGTVLDPSKPGCGDNVSVTNRFFGSLLFTNASFVSNGVNVGTTQLIDAFQRAEFWQYAKGSNYHVLLSPAASIRTLDVKAPVDAITQPGVCSGSNHNIGEIDINEYDNLVTGVTAKYAKANQYPIILTYNTFQTQNFQCCILGYHSAYNVRGGTQTYSVGAYNDAGIFSVPIEDIHAWTHEIGEWANDPFVQGFNNDNVTPAWGHVGQVGSCQNNLEVGDPLTGTPFALTAKGFKYHPQELAFFSWFYRTRSLGTAGKYSFEGSFKTAQGACS